MRPAGLSFLLRRQTPLSTATLSRRCLSTLVQSKTPSLAVALHLSSHAALRRRLLATTTDIPVGAQAHQKTDAPTQAATEQPEEEYHGPLATTFRRLKILSLSSLTLTFALTPFIFVLETTSSVPLAGRFALAGIAMATSSVSTALVAWCGRPYVTTLRFLELERGAEGAAAAERALEMTTLTLGLHKRVTTVYDTAFLVPTSRPFATWELAEAFQLAEAEAQTARAEGRIPGEETIAETKTAEGAVIGRRVVSWDEHGVGTCKDIGQVVP
ncbi:hypothetical protein TRAPUB_3713 [Trametes pubescens]|uniref:Uncharacterized protein n=1 Tax=Trametes pubescens TaxID=154538 RepID=A0A1M2VD31_TRAPU|nr:hypothetical protein TRAPUB_3713 [Trametes pubescens]